VLVARQHQVGVDVVERVPEVPQSTVVGEVVAPPLMVPEREDTAATGVGLEVLLKPPDLIGRGIAGGAGEGAGPAAVGVEGVHPPGPEVVGVPAEIWLAGLGAFLEPPREVAVEPRGARGGPVLVVAGDGAGPVEDAPATPRLRVPLGMGECFEFPELVLVVAERQHLVGRECLDEVGG
jgi:hypothetical protein